MQKSTLFLILNLLLFNLLQSQNLLVNGDFESGNISGFFVSGAGYTQIFPPFSGTTSSGNYAITTNPQLMNTASFIAGGDHTSGSGNMLVFDGNTTVGQQTLWTAGNSGAGVCSLTPGLTYTFSFWIKSVSISVTNALTQAQIGVSIPNADAVTLVSGSLSAPLPSVGWQKVTYTFVPVDTCVNIRLFNYNTSAIGNDFAIDDVSVTAPIVPVGLAYSVVNYSCLTSNDGAISAYATGGLAPFTYSLSGPTSAPSNTTGFFSNLTAGTYTVSVVDATLTTFSVNNLTISQAPNPLSVSPNTCLAPNNNTTLTVSGGNTYNWAASPSDASLTTPNLSSIVVSPTTTTVYTVSSTINSTSNLIYNGDFSIGNNGFATDYDYYAPSNPNGRQRTYGIVANASSWEPGFSPCTDHTTSTGNMMVVDGSPYNSGNDKVWSQWVPVVRFKTYTFSYWIQTIALNNPARIEVVINGVSIGSAIAPSTTCSWVQLSYTWNSGNNTTAQIAIYDRVTANNGNDFAIDDISFTSNNNCNYNKSVLVNVSNEQALVQISQPDCLTPTGTIEVLSPLSNAGVIATDLFISEVTDSALGSTTYIELYNGTGTPIDLSNYKLKIYNQVGPSASCDFALTGIIGVEDTNVIRIGDLSNQGGVIPDQVYSNCNGVNTNDNIRLTTIADSLVDIWGRTDGVDFTPNNEVGYTYRRISTAPIPSTTWNSADWTAIDPEDYSNVGLNTPFSSTVYEYNIDGGAWQLSTIISGLQVGPHTINVQNITTGCASLLNVDIIGNLTPSPVGLNNQTFTEGATLINLLVIGQDIQWYANPFGGTPLPLNTPLVNGTTYYASQTINGCESQYRFPVIVQLTLSNDEFGSIKIVYSPNPVIDILNIKASTILKNAKICNVLGQTIFQQRFNSNDIQLNMSDVPSGTYFVIVESDNRKETFKVLRN
jgi:hypothetical protein